LKTIKIKNPFHNISFKYDSTKWKDADEQLVKEFTEIITLGYEVQKTYPEISNRIKLLKKTAELLNQEFLKMKARRINLVEEKILYGKMEQHEQQKIQVAYMQKMDFFNVDIKVYQRKVDVHCTTCTELHASLMDCHHAYNDVAKKYDERDTLETEYFSENDVAIDHISFSENIMEFERKWDVFENGYDTLMDEWSDCMISHNAFLNSHNDFFNGIEEQQLQEKENSEKEKYDIPEGIGEQYLELYEKFENAEKSKSNIYLDIDEWGLLIDFYHVVNDFKRVAFTTDRAAIQHPDASQFKLRKSGAYVMANEFQKAIAIHKEVEALGEPFPAALHNSKGLLYDKMKMPEQAVREYEKCIERCDDEVGGLRSQAYLNMALVLKEQKKYTEAIDSLKQCIKNKHHNDKIINEIAFIYELTGQTSEAIAILEDFLNKNPSFHEVWLTLGNYYNLLALHEKAIEVFKKMLELKPNLPAALMSLGETHRRTGNYKDALGYYQQAIAQEPKQFIYHFCAGQCLEGLDDYENAKIYYKNSVNINPDFPHSLNALKRLKSEGK
jgi:tetratricopeptide (TPR) repeat protein